MRSRFAAARGFACETLAMRGITDSAADAVRRNLDATRALLALPSHDAADVNVWVRLNDEFHRTLTAESGNSLLPELIQQIGKIPMASAALVPTMTDNIDSVFDYVADAVRMHDQCSSAICGGSDAGPQPDDRAHTRAACG